MKPTAIEQKNSSSGREPELLDTATERGEKIPLTAEEINSQYHCTTLCLICACQIGGDYEYI